jgi:phosphatidylglycerol:prolipoprotein diacylglycerol transferase
MPFLIAYPVIDPVAIEVFGLPLRWYALAYIAGLVLGWTYARWLAANQALWGDAIVPPPRLAVDDLLVYAALGVIIGGRLGYVLFYNPAFYFAHPLEIPMVWKGGMAFHGGLAGTAIALYFLARRYGSNLLTLTDICAAAVPIGLFLGRIANFIKPELWGRATDVPWAMVFPGAGPFPRHPSQIYEALLEGFVLFILLFLAIWRGKALQRPRLVTGLFCMGYGLARITCEFFREPDPQLGFLFGGATMGMILSLPLLVLGIGFILGALHKPRALPA